jgi:hypothetical protein
MTLNIIKLCVGCDSIDDLAAWQASRLAQQRTAGNKKPRLYHTTFQSPKRQEELLDGGSLYWVIKGVISVRQPLTGFGEGTKENGSPCCLFYLKNELIQVRPTPRRPFQGWRYLTSDDAPPDLKGGKDNQVAEMPAALRKELASLGLL